MKKTNNFKFDDYRTPEQRQFFYEGLSKEPSMREKMEDIQKKSPPSPGYLNYLGQNIKKKVE